MWGKMQDILEFLDDLAYGDTLEANRDLRGDFKKTMQAAGLARARAQEVAESGRATRCEE